ncbi:MAG: CDP-alcohol phosphatidyltransferase family protein [Acidobacteria bacterium]|nr:CDP-alcohol phosphatidyltransferase family protein [Acidobacteriota bacterium]
MKKPDGLKMGDSTYVDLSDYARDTAVFIARMLAPTSIHAAQVTWFHFLLMLGAAFCLHRGTIISMGWAALLIGLKNLFDAVDGSLARLQNRPSRVGRFLDSDLDFIGNLVLFLAIPEFSLEGRIAGFLAFIFQGSIFNFYAVWYRSTHNGDATSKLVETGDSPYDYDDPRAMSILFFMYRIFYSWQDHGVAILDRFVAGRDAPTPNSRFMEFSSALGPGFQYLAIIFFLVLGTPAAIPDTFIFAFGIYAVTLLLTRSTSQSGAGRLGPPGTAPNRDEASYTSNQQVRSSLSHPCSAPGRLIRRPSIRFRNRTERLRLRRRA